MIWMVVVAVAATAVVVERDEEEEERIYIKFGRSPGCWNLLCICMRELILIWTEGPIRQFSAIVIQQQSSNYFVTEPSDEEGTRSKNMIHYFGN